MELMRTVSKALDLLQRKIALLLTRGTGLRVNSTASMQTLQVEALSGETLDEIEHFEPYGFTSSPLPGHEALIASLGGNRDHAICFVASDRRYRLKNLANGEVALWTDEGDFIHFKRGNHIHVNATSKVTASAPNVDVIATVQVLLDTPLVKCTGNIEANGNITDQKLTTGKSMQSMRDTYNTHTHAENDSGGPTDAPGQQM